MTVKFVSRNGDKVIVHEGVSLMNADSTLFGVTGYYLSFDDGTYCMVSKQSFTLVSVCV